jgi:hypothetical protein
MVKSGLDLDHRQHEHDHAHEQRHSCWSHSSKYARDSDVALSGATIVIGAAMSGVNFKAQEIFASDVLEEASYRFCMVSFLFVNLINLVMGCLWFFYFIFEVLIGS